MYQQITLGTPIGHTTHHLLSVVAKSVTYTVPSPNDRKASITTNVSVDELDTFVEETCEYSADEVRLCVYYRDDICVIKRPEGFEEEDDDDDGPYFECTEEELKNNDVVLGFKHYPKDIVFHNMEASGWVLTVVVADEENMVKAISRKTMQGYFKLLQELSVDDRLHLRDKENVNHVWDTYRKAQKHNKDPYEVVFLVQDQEY